LHVANLWNALYFSWDLEQRGYVAGAINPDRIPQRRMNERDFALPIGGFARVLTQTKAGELWAEVVYKEWAHPEVSETWVPRWISGAPAAPDEFAGEQVAVARERLVLDLDAFGPGFNDVTPKQYQRLLERRRWLDGHGHLVTEAMYPPEEADLDDLDFYARYLLDEHRDGLLAFCFREELGEEELIEALLRSLDSVREIASSADALASWRDKYFFDRPAFKRRCADEGMDSLFGADDLRSIFRCLAHPPKRRNASYTATGPQILELFDRRGDLEEEERALVRGPAYATAVCHANAYVRERLLHEAPEGLLSDGRHLRLDDDRQAGGIWRCEQVEGKSSLAGIPPTVPLHLGYGETSPKDGLDPNESEPEPVPTTVQGFRVALTGRDLDSGRLRLPDRVARTLGNGRELALRLRHDGYEDDQGVVLESGARALTGVVWPLSSFPGLLLWCNVERGGTVVKARSKKLPQSMTVDDGVELDHEFDEAVYRRETQARLPKEEIRKAFTITDLIYRAFRLHGRTTEDGGRALTAAEVVDAILGTGWQPEESRPVVAALVRMDLELREGEYICRPRITRRTSASDRALLADYGEAQPQGKLPSIVRRYLVQMHLRRLRGKHKSPSGGKASGYAEARSKFGFQGVLPATLPSGYTWVAPHERGGHEEALDASR
jgi:hypothetical protein